MPQKPNSEGPARRKDQGKYNEIISRGRATINKSQGKLVEVEEMCRQAKIYKMEGKLVEAEEIFREVLEVNERRRGLKAYFTAMALSDLVSVLKDQGKLVEAEEVNSRLDTGLEAYTMASLDDETDQASAFVGDLSQDIAFRGNLEALDRIHNRLSDLLETFTLRLEQSVNSKIQHDAKELIQRNIS